MKDLFGNVDEEGFYQYMIHRPLSVKFAESIGWIREYAGLALQIHPRGYYVAFSGGKDSIVLEKLFELAGVPYEPRYNNVTIDPPELIYFIRKHYPQVQWNFPQKHLIRMMAEKSNGPPTRLSRWCCEIYKEQGGAGRFKSIGVRAPESPRRKAAWSFLSSHRDDGTPILCPLIYWTDIDIWQFIHENHMPYCCLYDEVDCRGCKLFKRLGCVGCPMGGPAGQKKDFTRWPSYERMWRKGFEDYWNNWKGIPRLRVNKQGNFDRWIERMKTVDDLWEWWISGKAYEGEQQDCQSWLW